LAGDTDGNLFLVYVSGSNLGIAKGTRNSDGTAWSWANIYTRLDATEMGEGVLDRGRWDADRILSVFGQEIPPQQLDYGSGAMIDGMPAPVHVIDFHVSSSAVLPIPRASATGVATSATLNWTPGQGSVTHRVYLGTSREGVEAADTSSPEFKGELAEAVFTPDTLDQGQTYYWRVDGVQAGGAVIKGSAWSFQTSTGTGKTSWAGYPVANEFMDVDTGPFLAWINVAYGDWIWAYSMAGWLYCPEASVTPSGSWVYFLN
jgi:hypothetical protein